MKLYISGPVTGRPNRNTQNFHQVKRALIDAGYQTECPVDNIPENAPRDISMRLCVATICGCDGIALLDDWYESKGATMEVAVAGMLGIEVRMASRWIINGPNHNGMKGASRD